MKCLQKGTNFLHFTLQIRAEKGVVWPNMMNHLADAVDIDAPKSVATPEPLEPSSRPAKRKRQHKARSKRRILKKQLKREYHVVHKHEVHQLPVMIRTRAKASEALVRPRAVHRTHFRGQPLCFVGYELALAQEDDVRGTGLRSLKCFEKGDVITQYEGELITWVEAERVREGPDGKSRSSHFATTASKSCVINGYSLKRGLQFASPVGGVPLTRQEWLGRGGGSMCNHSANPNAELVRTTDDSCVSDDGIFVVALMRITANEFINVAYGSQFVKSNKSNI